MKTLKVSENLMKVKIQTMKGNKQLEQRASKIKKKATG
jgi:hypothetical protein